MSKYITGQEIINDLGLHLFEFYDEYVRTGLIPHNHLGQPFSPYDVMAQLFNIPHQKETLFQLNDSIFDLDDESAGSLRANRIIPLEQTIEELEARLTAYDGVGWADFALPANQGEAQYILSIVQASLFDRTDVVKMVGNKSGPQEAEEVVPNDEDGNHLPAEEKDDQEKSKPVHHTVMHKLRVQAKALELLGGKYKGYNAPELAITQEIREAAIKNDGTPYSKRKRIEWINEILPEHEKLKGRPKETD